MNTFVNSLYEWAKDNSPDLYATALTADRKLVDHMMQALVRSHTYQDIADHMANGVALITHRNRVVTEMYRQMTDRKVA